MDLIDRQEAIKALEKAGEVNYIATGDFHGIINALNVIKGLPNANPTLTQYSPKWIPCSERLPEGNLYVLVTYKYQYGLTDIGITWYSERENKWCDARPIIAWMPLPAPYKEDAE